ncbi:MAG: diguanylate cyclase [Deltaproteobacteria bacterium]|nr:diguanylate cyclase [Deltaproteobacteria bacterium]
MRGLPAVFGLLDSVTRERPLRQLARCPPLKCLEARSPAELGNLLERHHAPVAVLAFEALWPDPQHALQELRMRAPRTHLIVVHADEGVRLRLLRRLWGTGLCDDVVSRSAAVSSLTRVIRQAYADAAVEAAVHAAEALPSEVSRRYVSFLHRLGSPPTGASRVDTLVRDVQLGLAGMVDYDVLGVLLVPAHHRPRLHLRQARPVPHQLIWQLAEDCCAALAPLTLCPFEVDALEFVSADAPAEGEPASASPTRVCLPMVVAGELVGCLGLALSTPTDAPLRALLELVAHQVGSSLYHAAALDSADEAALTDELTGVHNRRYLMAALDSEWRRAMRYKHPLSIAMVDVDHFKPINDQHGHAVGDAVLCGFSRLLAQQLRDTDVVARYGGDEFVALFHNTGPAEAVAVLERLRGDLGGRVLYQSPQIGDVRVSLSAGVAGHPQAGALSATELLEVADDALRAAKLAGRNRVCGAAGKRLAVRGTHSMPAVERRRSSRAGVPAEVDFMLASGGHLQRLSASDISAGGLAVRGPQAMAEGALGLVFMPGEARPLPCRVVWVGQTDGGQYSAGLRFIERGDFERL